MSHPTLNEGEGMTTFDIGDRVTLLNTAGITDLIVRGLKPGDSGTIKAVGNGDYAVRFDKSPISVWITPDKLRVEA